VGSLSRQGAKLATRMTLDATERQSALRAAIGDASCGRQKDERQVLSSGLMRYAKAGAQGVELALPDTFDDPAALACAAREQNCLSIVAGPLRSQARCPRDLAIDLDRILAKAWAAYTLTANVIGPVLAEASDRGINVVVYKGAAQAARFYAEPWTRSMADVDLLVRDEEREGLHAILSTRNFRRRFTPGRVVTERLSHERSYAPPVPGARTVDIHISPAPPARYRLPVKEMMARAQPGTLFDAPVRFLTGEDELLVMAVNQAYDHFRLGLVRCLDAWLISRQTAINWSSLVADAQRAGAAVTTWLTLSNMKRVADVEVPPEALDELAPPAIRRAWLRAFLHTEGLGDPRHRLPRRIEQLFLICPVIDRPTDFARFLAFHGGLRVLDACQLLQSKVAGFFR
jgi:hypothetical protein